MIRFDDSLTFYNAHSLLDFIRRFTDPQPLVFNEGVSRSPLRVGAPFHTIILDCDRILSIDSTALFRFEEMVHHYASQQV